MAGTKKLYFILLVSIALNIFIIGYIAGDFIHKPEWPQNSVLIPQGVFKSLPEQNQKALAEAIKKQQQEIAANHNEILRLRLEIARTLAEDPLDQRQLSALFEKMSQLSNRNMTLAQQGLYQTLVQLPKAQRLKIAKALADSAQKSQRPPISGMKNS